MAKERDVDVEKLKKSLLKEVPTKLKKKLTGKNSTNEDFAPPEGNKPMGIGVLGTSHITFARKFRWTLGAEHLPEHFMKTVSIDYANNKLTFEYYDVLNGDTGFDALVWADQIQRKLLPYEFLVFQTFDGCGTELYRVLFEQLSILEHNSAFDYASSDESIQRVTVGYKKCEKILVACPSPFQNPDWKAQFFDIEGREISPQVPVYLENRPTLSIEETEINFLNAKTYIPGKASWENLELKDLPIDVRTQEFGDCVLGRKEFRIKLTLNIDSKPVEIWQLQNAWVQAASYSDKSCSIKIRYGNVKYESLGANNVR